MIDPPFTISEYQRRRERLMASIGPESVAIVPSSTRVRRNSDVDFPFRQDSNFFYLTGLDEPDSVLVLAPGHPHAETTLLLRARDHAREQWVGERLGVDRAAEALGIDQALDTASADKKAARLLEDRAEIHTMIGTNPKMDKRIFAWIDTVKRLRKTPPARFCQLSETLHELRVVKSEAELQAMQTASDISAEAHQRAMELARPGLYEYHLEGEILHAFFQHGTRFPSYPSIVGSGANACVLHYTSNSARLNDGDLVLIDAGCEFQYYGADITRTFPVNGKFSPRQRDVYQIVLQAQEATIDAGKPGAPFSELQDTSFRHLTQGLIDLGILKASLDEALEKKLATPFNPHSCSHFLGLDVHDVGAIRQGNASRTLCEGMVFTVEPGLYFPRSGNCPDFDEGWLDIGVRIEDDIVVEEIGNRVITSKCPKEIKDIEELMNGR